jgi:hypothetical protein
MIHKIIIKYKKGAMREMMSNIADWFITGLYLIFIAGVVIFAYYQIKMRR